MIRLIRFLITGDWHLHKWKIIKEGPFKVNNSYAGYYYNLQCVTCGKVKGVNVI